MINRSFVLELPPLKTGRIEMEGWNMSLVSSEQSILTMLRAGYGQFEQFIKGAAEKGTGGSLPAGLLNDALVVFRCLIFNELKEYKGKFVTIARL
jgi:hypothetical protein